MKKSYIALIILLLVVIILAIAFIFITRDPSYDKAEIYSKEAVQEILDKSKNLKEVNINVSMSGEYIISYLRDNLLNIVHLYDDGYITIFNKNVDEDIGIVINEKDKTIKKMNLSDLNIDAGYINLNDAEYFKYLGMTKIDDKDVIVIKKDKDSNFLKKILFIDKETGIVLRETEKTPFDIYDKVVRSYELDNVSDEDIEFVDYQKIYPDYEYTEEN